MTEEGRPGKTLSLFLFNPVDGVSMVSPIPRLR
jgi:hypothetical protein